MESEHEAVQLAFLSSREGIVVSCLDFGERHAGVDGGAILDEQLLEDSAHGRGDRHGGLVRLDLADDLVDGDLVALGLLPPDVALRDGLGEGGALDRLDLVEEGGGRADGAEHLEAGLRPLHRTSHGAGTVISREVSLWSFFYALFFTSE